MPSANEILKTSKKKMQKAVKVLQSHLGRIRAGRANASLLNGIKADYYGAPTPINQLASITTPEPRVLMVTPFDKGALKGIEKGILKSNIGLNPANDGDVIRLVIPQLTDDRRKELSKKSKAVGEQTKVAIRNVRRDAMDDVKKGDKDSTFTDDQMHRLEDQIQKLTNQGTKGVDKVVKNKQKEIESE